jgi:hypothetical protein
MIVSSDYRKRNLWLAILLLSLILIGAACSSGGPLEAKDLMPTSRQIKGGYIRQGETSEFELTIPPSSVLKREWVTSQNHPDNYQFYIMVLVYENEDEAGFTYFEIAQSLREGNDPSNPMIMDTEYEKLEGVDNTILMYQALTADLTSGQTFAEVWRVFRKGNVVVICESLGFVDPFDPEPGLQKRIDETLYYAELIRDKIE